MKKIFDTHCHLNMEPYTSDLNNYLNQINIDDIIMNVVGTDLNSSIQAIKLANCYNNIYATIGIHPNDVEQYDLAIFDELESLIKNNKKIIAIGETGLDYHYQGYNQNKQLLFFNKHLQLALKYNLTLVIHVRDAHNDTIKFLQAQTVLPRIIIHCFSGTKQDLLAYIKLKCYISISGIVTFKNALALKSIINDIPNELLLSETDAPFLTPTPYRGKTNLPNYVKYVNNELANLKAMDVEELQMILLQNAYKCFNIN